MNTILGEKRKNRDLIPCVWYILRFTLSPAQGVNITDVSVGVQEIQMNRAETRFLNPFFKTDILTASPQNDLSDFFKQ